MIGDMTTLPDFWRDETQPIQVNWRDFTVHDGWR